MLDFVRKNLDLLSAALDAMPEKVLVLDHTGRVRPDQCGVAQPASGRPARRSGIRTRRDLALARHPEFGG